MECTVEIRKVNYSELLIVGIDVGKSRVSFHTEIDSGGSARIWDGEVMRRTYDLRRFMKKLDSLAAENGLAGVLVVCEPTGGFEKLVFSVARSQGCRTALVSGQATSMLSKVESNDTGKTDAKDARTIYMAGSMRRTLTQRNPPDLYRDMQCVNRIYEAEDESMVRVKGLITAEVEKIFPDFPWKSDRLYGNAGQALIEVYGCDPVRIVFDGREKFEEKMRVCRHHLRATCLGELWRAAQESSLNIVSIYSRHNTATRIIELNSDYNRHLERKKESRNKLMEFYVDCPESFVLATIPGISAFLMARIIAETGPLKDFGDARKLIRFAGLNLRERKSGKYKGKNRITKRGNPILRKVLYQQVVTQLCKKGRCLHEKYQKTKSSTGLAIKSAVSIMRHFLKLIFSMTRRNTVFNQARLSDSRVGCGKEAA